MGLSILFTGPEGDDGPFSLATASGWRRFGEWVGSLPPGEFKSLRALCDIGQANDTSALAADLTSALDTAPPGHPDVRSTAEALLENVGVGDAFESAIVADEDGGEDPSSLLANARPMMANGWVTLASGQHIYLGEGGDVEPTGPKGATAPPTSGKNKPTRLKPDVAEVIGMHVGGAKDATRLTGLLKDMMITDLYDTAKHLGIKATIHDTPAKVVRAAIHDKLAGKGSSTTASTPTPTSTPPTPHASISSSGASSGHTSDHLTSLAENWHGLPGAKDNRVALADIQDHLKLTTPQLHSMVNDLRQKGIAFGETDEGRAGTSAEKARVRAAGIAESHGIAMTTHIGIREERAHEFNALKKGKV